MPIKKSPYTLPVSLYVDDLKKEPQALLSDEELALSNDISDMMRAMGHENLAEYLRPPTLLGPSFRPMATLAKLKEQAAECNGVAGLVCFDREKAATVVYWDASADDSLHKLTKLKLAGGWIVGVITRSDTGEYRVYPEPAQSSEQEAIWRQFLTLITQEYIELPALAGQPEEATKILQNYPWPESGPVSLDEIVLPVCTENEPIGEQHAR